MLTPPTSGQMTVNDTLPYYVWTENSRIIVTNSVPFSSVILVTTEEEVVALEAHPVVADPDNLVAMDRESLVILYYDMINWTFNYHQIIILLHHNMNLSNFWPVWC